MMALQRRNEPPFAWLTESNKDTRIISQSEATQSKATAELSGKFSTLIEQRVESGAVSR